MPGRRLHGLSNGPKKAACRREISVGPDRLFPFREGAEPAAIRRLDSVFLKNFLASFSFSPRSIDLFGKVNYTMGIRPWRNENDTASKRRS
jgi:hypothetical protein